MEDRTPESAENLAFSEVLASLGNEQEPVPAKLLYRLSGLEGQELLDFSKAWAAFSTQRKLNLLEDLEILAESNTVMHFDDVAALGLDEDDEAVRILAIRSLWQSSESKLIPIFISLLNEENSPQLSAQAAAALGRFILLGELGEISSDQKSEIEQQLLAIMDSDNDQPEIRRRALESLAYSSNPRVEGLIEDAYDFGDEEIKASALFAMGRNADDRWAPQVIESLDDPNPDLSIEAIRSAGELQINEALPTLINSLFDEDGDIRLAAAWSLSQIGGKDATDALADFQDRSEDEDEIDLIEDAIENLTFGEDIADMNILNFSEDDLDNLANPPADNIETDDSP
jgi:HEAT repeat protein